MVGSPANPEILRPRWGRLLGAGLLAGVLAGTLNALIYLAARSLGAMPQDVLVGPAQQPMSLFPVVSLTVIAALIGAALFGVLSSVTRRATTLFLGIAGLVLALSFLPPFTIGAPMGMALALNLMHVVAAAVTVFLVLQRTP